MNYTILEYTRYYYFGNKHKRSQCCEFDGCKYYLFLSCLYVYTVPDDSEKIYLFLWFWMILLVIVSVLSFLVWTVRVVNTRDSRRYIKHHLQFLNELNDQDDKQAKKFVSNYLKQDGVFVLRLVGHNTNVLAVTELIASLFENYKSKPRSEGCGDDETPL